MCQIESVSLTSRGNWSDKEVFVPVGVEKTLGRNRPMDVPRTLLVASSGPLRIVLVLDQSLPANMRRMLA